MCISKFSLFSVLCILIIAGVFTVSCSDKDNPAASTDLPGSWAAVGSGVGVGIAGQVFAMTTYDYKLIMGGNFTSVDGVSASNIAAWNGTSWTALDGGVTGGPVMALGTYATLLIVGGGFDYADGISTNRVAIWTNSWGYFPSGREEAVYAIEVIWDHIFVGSANGAGGGLAFFEGSSWIEMETDITVNAFTEYDDDLIIGGTFIDFVDGSGDNITSFTGMDGSSLGSGINGSVYALTVLNDKLIAGGYFSSAGGVNVSNIAAWDGSTWAPLGSGLNGAVKALAVLNGRLYAGGEFTSSGGTTAKYIAAWDGSAWKSLGSGMDGSVNSLTTFDNKLIAGGGFTTAGGITVHGIASWTAQ